MNFHQKAKTAPVIQSFMPIIKSISKKPDEKIKKKKIKNVDFEPKTNMLASFSA